MFPFFQFSGQTVQDSYLSFVENYKTSGKVIENALQTKSSVQKFVEVSICLLHHTKMQSFAQFIVCFFLNPFYWKDVESEVAMLSVWPYRVGSA